MTVRQTTRRILAAGVLALALSATSAASAGASPAWKLEEGLELPVKGETALAYAPEGSMTLPGLTTTCDFPFGLKIWNTAGTAGGRVDELPLNKCATSGACAVEAATAEGLPWALHGTTVKSKNYVVIEGIKIAFLYEGALCPLAETVITVKGSAGGLFNNATHSFTFDSSSFSATKTKVAALGTTVEWQGVFSTVATGANSGLGLEL